MASAPHDLLLERHKSYRKAHERHVPGRQSG
jgi:hypothetical protein